MGLKCLALLTAVFVTFPVAAPAAQDCAPGAALTAEQKARRQEGIRLARTVHNLEANQPGSATKTYLRQVELPTSPFAARQTGASAQFLEKLNFTPGEELTPGWELTLDVTPEGYWFMLKDKTDPCGFAYVSNQQGVIYLANPLR